jgi:signal transduction histidine kinase/CheY-like chemotaxis protein
MGEQAMANWFGLVDEVKRLMGGTATIFVKHGTNFVRVCTNVERADGSRAVGTILDPKGKAIINIRKGIPFYGVVDILGRSYLTGYDPIVDKNGEIVGVWYVGYLINTLARLGEGIQNTKILDNGFLALVDPKKDVLFQSAHASTNLISEAIGEWRRQGKPERWTTNNWNLRVVPFQQWDMVVLAGTYLPDVTRETWQQVAGVFGVITFVIIGVLIIAYGFALRLSSALVKAEKLQIEAQEARKVADESRDAAEEANRTKSSFLANMSHELRTPMNAIIGYTEILSEDAKDDGNESYLPDLQKIHQAAKHLLGLINDVLDLSKIEAGKMTIFTEVFDIKSTIDNAVATIKPLVDKKGNSLEVHCPEDIGQMRSDITKVRQALFNLLSNASKFTENGRVRLDVAREKTPAGDFIIMRVTDTGIGMTLAQMGKLFQAFAQADVSTTRKFGGTGLGLIISRSFCQMLGGDITVNSELDKGSVFTIRLPAETSEIHELKESIHSGKPLPAEETNIQANTLLVIDDDPAVRDLLERQMTREGFVVKTVGTGKEGLAIAKQMLPSVITLDVMMPGMDGWAVLSALKADPQLAQIPVIMLTMSDQKDLGFSLGATDYFSKPVDREKLAATVAKYRVTGQEKILLVEDDDDTRDVMETTLKKGGWRVTTAVNGREALKEVQKGVPTLILLDLMMPVMDGFEFLRIFREKPEHHKVPVIVLTAMDLTPVERQNLNGKVLDILQKGAYRKEDLLREIKSLIQK